MPELEAKRTLVKSPPELWAELSEEERLAKHLEAFGEIKITMLDPEHTVAWEGENASGTVSIEPSGWGTRVIMTAELPEEPRDAAADVEPSEADGDVVVLNDDDDDGVSAATAEPQPPERSPAIEDAPQRRRGFWARLFSGWLVPKGGGAFEPVEREATAIDESAVVSPIGAELDGNRGVPDEELDSAGTDSPAEAPAMEPRDAIDPAEAPAMEPRDAIDPAEAPATEPRDAIDPERALSVLDETLDALGSAHHRPFSRA